MSNVLRIKNLDLGDTEPFEISVTGSIDVVTTGEAAAIAYIEGPYLKRFVLARIGDELPPGADIFTSFVIGVNVYTVVQLPARLDKITLDAAAKELEAALKVEARGEADRAVADAVALAESLDTEGGGLNLDAVTNGPTKEGL